MKYSSQIFTKYRTDMVVITLHNSQQRNDDNVCPYFPTPFHVMARMQARKISNFLDATTIRPSKKDINTNEDVKG